MTNHVPRSARPSARTVSGFSLLELLLALALVSFAVALFVGAILYGNETMVQQYFRLQARLMASECLNVARWLRDDGGLDALPEGTHGLAVQNGRWEWSGTSDETGPYARHVDIGSEADHGKDVSCTVRWDGQFGQREVVLMTRLSSWQ